MAEKPTYEELEKKIQEFEQVESKWKRAEKAIQETEQFITSVFESIQDGISVLNPDLSIRYVNNVMKKWYAENLPLEGKKCFECYHNANNPCTPCPTLRCFKSGKTEMDIVPGLPGSDAEWLELYSYPIRDDKTKEITGVVEFVRDITKRKKIEESLRKSETDLKEAQKVAHVGLWDLNILTGVLYWSDEAYRIYGFKPQEFVPTYEKFKAIIHPEDYERVQKAVDAALKGAAVYDIDFKFMKPNGQTGWVHCDGQVTNDSEGNPIRFFGTQIDITERKQVEDELRESEGRLNIIFESAPDTYYLNDFEGVFVDGNRAAEELLGYSREELIGKNFMDAGILSMDQVEKALDALAENINGKSTGPDEYILKRKDGTKVDVEILTHPVKIGGEGMVLGIARDITERNRARKALIKSENLYKEAQSLAHIGYWDYEPYENTLFWSDELYSIFEIDRSAGPLVIEDFLNRIHPEDRDNIKEQVEKKKGYRSDYRIVMENGSVKHMHERVQIIRQEDGKFVLMKGTAQDITERKKTENALRESEKKYRSMMESMKDASYICSPEFRIEYMNPAMIERVGRDASGEVCYKAIYNQDEKCPWCVFDQIEQKEHVEYEVADPKDNNYYLVMDSPISHTDGTLSKLTIFRDITAIKTMEGNLRQAQRMEAIGTLAGGIAHDFNNILFPILGYADMLLADIPEDSPFRDGLNGILTSALRAKDLVRQILTFSRQDTNELLLMKIQPVVKEALKLIRSTISTTIDITQDIRADCRAIKADPTQIHQIVMNLTTNAYHAMEDTGGELRVGLKEIQLDEHDVISPDLEPGAYACLTVSDTGTGMNKDVIEKIFDPFFTTKEVGKGTGMGLSVVHGIVKNIGGSIHVYSEPGKGTEFKAYFPIEKSSFEKQNIQTKEPIQGGTERILLVDDEDVIIAMGKRVLEHLGYQVTSRTSSIEALEAFRANPDKFDLVITDLAMPNMPGDKLSTELIKIRSDIPILLCTGFSEIMSEEKAASLGIKGFLLKPIVMKDLSQKIREVLDSNKTENTN